jgi:hypothetical protein
MEALEVDALFEVHLRDARRLQWPVPLVHWLQVVGVDGGELRFLALLGQRSPPLRGGVARVSEPGWCPSVRGWRIASNYPLERWRFFCLCRVLS